MDAGHLDRSCLRCITQGDAWRLRRRACPFLRLSRWFLGRMPRNTTFLCPDQWCSSREGGWPQPKEAVGRLRLRPTALPRAGLVTGKLNKFSIRPYGRYRAWRLSFTSGCRRSDSGNSNLLPRAYRLTTTAILVASEIGQVVLLRAPRYWARRSSRALRALAKVAYRPHVKNLAQTCFIRYVLSLQFRVRGVTDFTPLNS